MSQEKKAKKKEDVCDKVKKESKKKETKDSNSEGNAQT
jgi:hypothetical protein